MPQYLGGLCHGSQGDFPPEGVPETLDHGGKFRRLPCSPLQRFQGYDIGRPLYPTIFNLVVDTVIQHWFMVVSEEEDGPDSFRWAVKRLEFLFYFDNVLLASERDERLQW